MLTWILIISMGLLGYFILYDNYLKYELNALQASLIEKRLKRNYHEHADQLADFSLFLQQFSHLDVDFLSEENMVLTVDHDLPNDWQGVYHVFIEGDSIDLDGVKLQPQDLHQLLTHSTLFDEVAIPHWQVVFRGPKDSPLATMLLAYEGVNPEDFERIKEGLEEVNCVGLIVSPDQHLFRYRGGYLESFNYLTPVGGAVEPAWEPLSENFYWEHFEHGMLCGWTDWGWF